MKGFIQNLIKGCLSFISSGHTQACWTLETFWSNYSIVSLFQGEIFVAIMFGVFGRIEMFGYLLFTWDMTCKSDPISKGLTKATRARGLSYSRFWSKWFKCSREKWGSYLTRNRLCTMLAAQSSWCWKEMAFCTCLTWALTIYGLLLRSYSVHNVITSHSILEWTGVWFCECVYRVDSVNWCISHLEGLADG